MDGRPRSDHGTSPSVIVDDLDIVRIAVLPAKADPELIIDADAPLSAPVALQSFQLVARRAAQSFHGNGRVQHRKLALGWPDEIGREALGSFALPYPLGQST